MSGLLGLRQPGELAVRTLRRQPSWAASSQRPLPGHRRAVRPRRGDGETVGVAVPARFSSPGEEWDAVANHHGGGRGVGNAAGRSDGGRNHRGLQPAPARPGAGACLHDETGLASVWLCRQKNAPAAGGDSARRPGQAPRVPNHGPRIPVERLVFLDESGMHLAMSRSHTWVKRGTVPRPRAGELGHHAHAAGAIRVEGWVVLRSMFATANGVRFVAWLTTHLLPKLRRGDVLVMDNLRAHHNPRVTPACRAHGVRVRICVLPRSEPD